MSTTSTYKLSTPYRDYLRRVRQGEVVAISTKREDFGEFWDWLMKVPAPGILIQMDTEFGLIWLSRAPRARI